MNRRNLILVILIILGSAIFLGLVFSNGNPKQAVLSGTIKNNTEKNNTEAEYDTKARAMSLISASGSEATTAPSEQTTNSSSTPNSSSDGPIYVIGANYKCAEWSNETYPLIRLFGENYVPLYSNDENIWNAHVDKLARLVLDLPSRGENYTLKTGEKLDLGNGYTLGANQVYVSGQSVWLELDKDGKYVDDQVISVDTDLKTWTCALDNIQGESEVPVLRVFVSKVYYLKTDSVVQIDGLWLIDYANTKALKVGDKFGEYTLTEINSGVDASNFGSLVFERNIQNDTQDASSAPTPMLTPTPHLQ